MSVPMIKHNGKMVPAKKDANGKFVPDEGAVLVYDGDTLNVAHPGKPADGAALPDMVEVERG